jgi:hypothetical protein
VCGGALRCGRWHAATNAEEGEEPVVSPLGAVRMLRPGRAGRRHRHGHFPCERKRRAPRRGRPGTREPKPPSGSLPPPPLLFQPPAKPEKDRQARTARHGTAWRGVLTAAAACGRGDRLTRGVRSAAGDLARSQCHHHGRRRWRQRAGWGRWKWNGSTRRAQGSKAREGNGGGALAREGELQEQAPDTMGPDPVECSRPPRTRARLLAALREHHRRF